MITLADVRNDPEVEKYIRQGHTHLAAIGYTEHGFRHVTLVANICQILLSRLGYAERDCELAAIAAYLHDIGNVVNRSDHALSGALLARDILTRLGMDYEEVAVILGAIGNHDEKEGQPVSPISAALILADKSDVHRTRVRNREIATFDIHDRVNYAVEHSFLRVDGEKKTITLELTIDTTICPVIEYFEIFLFRMMMCRRAAVFLGCSFHLLINGAHLL